MKKIRTVGELEAITRFMYEKFRSSLIEQEEFSYDDIDEYDDLADGIQLAHRSAVESLLNHLETVEELELKK